MKIAMITGYLGAGKTTLLNHVLANQQGIRAAVIVNDIGEVNIDADLVAQSGSAVEAADVVPMTNGCICCTLADDLAAQLRQIANTRAFDYIVIEASGICEPAPIAYTISGLGEDALPDDEPVELDNIIAMVDCARMYDEFDGGRAIVADDVDEDDVEALLIQQIEFCTTLVLNKTDLVTPEQIRELKAIVRSLQRKAKIVEATQSQVPIDDIMNTGRFDFERAFTSATWAEMMEGDHDGRDEEGCDGHDHDGHDGHDGHGHDHDGHDHDGHGHDHHGHHHHGHHHHDHDDLGYGISTFVYQRRQPFDMARFTDFVANWPQEVVRCKGILRHADAPDVRFLFEQAGRHFYLTDNGLFIAAQDEADRQAVIQANPELLNDWDDELGDRMTKLVFIGRHMDRVRVEAALDACLLS